MGNSILSTSCEFHFNDITVTSVINIMQMPTKVSHKVQCWVFCYLFFLWPKGFSANAIHTEINPMYGDFYKTSNTCLVSNNCQLITDVGSGHLRSADVHTCMVPRTQSRLGDRSFGVAGPRLGNSLPGELRQQDFCLTEFRRLLKTFLFAETRRIVTSLFWWRRV